MIACSACGAENRDRAKFCNECGTSLAAPSRIPEERKVVTTLFCDLVAFTAMSEAADPEDVDAVLRAYHAAARKVIESHGGTVEKFIGDAVVGVFGVPAVHEDDPERAVRAGLRVLEALEGMTRPDGSPLQARCGVNTGEALVRLDVAPGSGEGFLTGDAVNTAARLQAAAPPMGVVAGHLTYELTREAVDYDLHPPVAAKGKAEPVQAWLAKQAHARTGLRTSGLSATPLLGRNAELAELDEALDEAVGHGEARFALVVGEPGIGKSRLALEFGHVLDARTQLTTWRIGRCLPYGDGVTFRALGEVVKEHTGILDSDDVATMEAKLDRSLADADDVPWLRQRLRPLLGLTATGASRDENFAAWTGFLQLIASGRPAVVVLEDLHWAGDGMLAFVDHLLGQAIGAPLLVVATARPELLERHDGLLTTGDPERLRRVTLPALSDRHAGSLVSHLLDPEPPPEVRKRVVSAAGGNPLYAEQYVRLLLDRGLVGGPPTEAGGGSPGEELLLPDTLHAVLAARLDTLSPDHKALLADAAVLGETFWRGGVTALSGRDETEVEEVMALLCSRDLVRPALASTLAGEPEYLFWHALTRDVAYGQLPRRVRARKHHAAAEWVAGLAAGRGNDFAEIEAHHATTALDLATAVGDERMVSLLVAPAIDALRRAGELGLRLDIMAAERHLTRALELAESAPQARAELLLSWAKLLLLTNRYREAVTAFDEAIDELTLAGENRRAALALCWSADALAYLNEPSLHRMRAAVDLLSGDGPSCELVEILSHYALGLSIHDEDARLVLATAERAIEMSELLGSPEPAVALSTRGLVRCSLGDPAGLEDCRRAEAVAQAQGLGIERSTIMINHSNLRFLIDGAEAWREAVSDTLAFVTSHGLAMHAGACQSSLIHCAYERGEWDEALGRIEAALPELERLENQWDLLFLRALQALVFSARGEPASAGSFLEWLIDRGAVSEVGWSRGYALLSAGAVLCAGGESAKAGELLRACFEQPQAASAIVEALPEALRTALVVGDEELPARLMLELESVPPASRLPLQRHVLSSCDALLEERRGRHEAAAQRFENAVASWGEFGVPYEEAHALLGQGRCLMALDRAQEAARPLQQAREIFARLGAKPALVEVDRVLGEIAPSPR